MRRTSGRWLDRCHGTISRTALEWGGGEHCCLGVKQIVILLGQIAVDRDRLRRRCSVGVVTSTSRETRWPVIMANVYCVLTDCVCVYIYIYIYISREYDKLMVSVFKLYTCKWATNNKLSSVRSVKYVRAL